MACYINVRPPATRCLVTPVSRILDMLTVDHLSANAEVAISLAGSDAGHRECVVGSTCRGKGLWHDARICPANARGNWQPIPGPALAASDISSRFSCCRPIWLVVVVR